MTKLEKNKLQDMIQDVVEAFDDVMRDLSCDDEFWDAIGKLQDYVFRADGEV